MTVQKQTRDDRGKPAVGYVEEGSAFAALSGTGREPAAAPSPARLTDCAFAFHRTAALRAAVRLDIFTAIGEGHDTPAALAGHRNVSERGVRILCDFLVTLGLLDKQGEIYVRPPDVATSLDRRSRAFIGDALEFVAADTVLNAVLSDSGAAVRNGGTVLGETEHFVAPDQADWATYARALAPMMARSAAGLAELIASRNGTAKRILDIAAGPGQNGIALAKRVPDARVTAIDWPNVLEIAQANARAAGVGERWQASPGDALKTPLGGPYDVIIVARFLHLLARQDGEVLLRSAHSALAPGGRVAVLEILLNDDHVSPPFAAMMNFNVLATTPSGQLRTAGELEAWLRMAGLDPVEHFALPDSDERIVIGWRQQGDES